MCLLGSLSVDRVNVGNRSQERRQCRETIHHGLIVALNEKSNSADCRDQTLQAFALKGEETHDEKRAVKGEAAFLRSALLDLNNGEDGEKIRGTIRGKEVWGINT